MAKKRQEYAISYWRNGDTRAIAGAADPGGIVDFDGEAYIFTVFNATDEKIANSDRPEDDDRLLGAIVCVSEAFAEAVYNAVKSRKGL